MSFNWKVFINLAEYLIKNHNPDMNEGWIRTSISRSYYGTYGIASELIKSKGIRLPREKTHKFVSGKYTISGNNKQKKLVTD